MLEEIKEVLIKEKKDELERKKKIDNEIKKTLLETDENDLKRKKYNYSHV